VVGVDVTGRSAVVVLKIDRLEPVDALVDDSLAGLAAGSDGETISITAVEVLVTSEALEGGVAVNGDTRPAGLDAEVVVELVEEALGSRVALGVIVPAVSAVGDERLAEVETLAGTSSGKVVAVLATSEEGDRVGGVGTSDGGEEGGGEGTRVLGTSGDVDVALELVVVEARRAVDLTDPSGLLGALVVADSDEDAVSVDDLGAEADGLLAVGDTGVVVVGKVSVEGVDLVGVGGDLGVLGVLLEDEVEGDGDISGILGDSGDGEVVRGRSPSARGDSDGARVLSSAASVSASISTTREDSKVVGDRGSSDVRDDSRDGVSAVSSEATSREPSLSGDGERGLSHKESDGTTLDVEETSLTEGLIGVEGRLDAVELEGSLSVDVAGDERDGLSGEDGVDVDRGDVDLVGDNDGSEDDSDVGASGDVSLGVGLLGEGDVVGSISEFAGGDLKDKVAGLVRVGGELINVAEEASGGAVTRVDGGNERRTNDTRELEDETRVSSGNIIRGDLELVDDGLTDGDEDISGVLKSEVEDLLTNLGGDLVGTSGRDGEVVVLGKVRATSIEDTVDTRGDLLDGEDVLIVDAAGTSEEGGAGVDLKNGVLREGLNDEGDVRQGGTRSAALVVEVVESGGLTVGGGARLILDEGNVFLELVEEDGDLVDSKVVVDGGTVVRVTEDGEGEVVEAADVVKVNVSRGELSVEVSTVLGGREALVIDDVELDVTASDVLGDEVQDVILRTGLGARGEVEVGVLTVLSSLADSLVGLEDGGLVVTLELDVVLDGVELASLRLTNDDDPEGGGVVAGKLSRVVEVAETKVEDALLTFLNIRARELVEGNGEAVVRRIIGDDGVLAEGSVDRDSSLGDLRDADGEEEVLVVLGLNIVAVVLDVGAVGEVKVFIVVTVDGGRDDLTIINDGDDSIVELNVDDRSTGSVSPDVVTTLDGVAETDGGDGAVGIIRTDSAREGLKGVGAVITRVGDGRLEGDRDGSLLVGIEDLAGDREGEAEGGSDLSVLEIIVELDGLISLIGGVLDNSGAVGSDGDGGDVGLGGLESVTDGEVEVGVGLVGELLVVTTDSDVVTTLLISADIEEESASLGLSSAGGDARRDGALAIIRRGSTDGVLLDEDLDASAGGSDLDGQSGSIDADGLSLVVVSLVLDRVDDLSDGLAVFEVLDGGLVLVDSEGEGRVGGVEDTEEVGSSLGSARGKTDSINDAPTEGRVDSAVPLDAALAEDLDGEIRDKTVAGGSEVDDEVVATRGELVGDVDGIAVVAILRGRSSSLTGDSEDGVGGVNAVTISVLSGGSDLSVGLRDDGGSDVPSSSSVDADANVVGTGLEGEGRVAGEDLDDTASRGAGFVKGNVSVASVGVSIVASNVVKVDEEGDVTVKVGDLDVEEVGQEAVDSVVGSLNVLSSDLELVLEERRTEGSVGISAALIEGEISGRLREVDREVVGLEVLLAADEIEGGAENRDVPVTRDELAVREFEGVDLLSSDVEVVKVVVASLISGVEISLGTSIRTSEGLKVDVDNESLSRVVELGDVDDEVGEIKIISSDGEGVEVVLLTTKTISDVGADLDVVGEGDLDNGGLDDLSDAEAEGSGGTSASEVADGDVEAGDIEVAALRRDEAELVVTVLSGEADIVVATNGVSKGLGLDVDDSSSVDELSLDDNTTAVGLIVRRELGDVDEERAEALSLSGDGGDSVLLGGEGSIDDVDLRGEVDGSVGISGGVGADVADTPLNRVRETVEGSSSGGRGSDGDDSEEPVGGLSVSLGGSEVASPDADNAALTIVRRGTEGRISGTSADLGRETEVVVLRVITGTGGTTRRLSTRATSGDDDVSGVVGGQRDRLGAGLTDAVSLVNGGGAIKGLLVGADAASVRSSG
jgi:hypothetical protein